MFYYTKSAYNLVYRRFKLVSMILGLLLALLGTGYYVYASIVGIGYLWASIPLATIYGLYGIFGVVAYCLELKKSKKIVNKVYKGLSYSVRAFALASTLYGFYVASESVKPLAIVLTTLMIIVWVIQVVFELVSDILWPQARYLIAGVMKDVEPYANVFNKVADLAAYDTIELPLDQFEEEINKIAPDAVIAKAEASRRRKDRIAERKKDFKVELKDKLTSFFKKKK